MQIGELVHGTWADIVSFPAAEGATGKRFSRIIKRKTADETVNNSATLQNDDHLSFPIAANEVWTFDLRLFIVGDATADLKAAFTWPTGATAIWAPHGQRAADSVVTSAAGTSTSGTAVSLGADAGPALLVIAGTIENASTAGTVQLQWAQQTATVANTTVKRGSVLIADRLA